MVHLTDGPRLAEIADEVTGLLTEALRDVAGGS